MKSLTKVRYLLEDLPTDGGNSTPAEVDPLSEAAGGIDTSFPVLAPDRLLEFTIKSCKCEKNEKGNYIVKMKVSVNKDTTFNDGKPCRAGFSFVQTLNLTPSEKFPIEDVKRNIALWTKAVFGAERAKSVPLATWRDNPEQVEQMVFTARTGINKDKNGVYADSTKLTPVIAEG